MWYHSFVFTAILWISLHAMPTWAGHVVGADFNGDGVVNFGDFVLFGGAFGSTQAKYDLNENGVVDFGDFVAFASVFGERIMSGKEITLASLYPGARFSAGFGLRSVVGVDMNEDGFADVVTANFEANNVSVLLNMSMK